MKQRIQIVITSVASLVACAALAQQTALTKTDRANDTREGMAHPRADRLNGAAKASDLIGMPVKNYQGEKLGKVEDLAVDVESGRIVQVILSSGGFAGVGDTLVAVPPGALHHDVAQKVIHLDANPEKLKSAPRFDNAKWYEETQPTRVMEVYAYYDEQPYFVAKPIVAGTTSADVKLVSSLPRHLDGTANTEDGAKTVEKVRNEAAVRKVADSHKTFLTRSPDGSWTREYYPKESGTNLWISLGNVQKASKLMGMPVQNQLNEKLGEVENLLVDLSAGRIVAVIVSSGGFLGMGDELSAIPAPALQFTSERDTLRVNASKEMLSNAPHFKANQWPDFAQPSYAGGVYRAYNEEPYFTGEATTEADNTGRNVRDRNERTLTPLDQGNSKADIATTTQIRKEITASKNMSINAQNVKIITMDGQVTLRGPVNTAEEKRMIGEIATRIARAGKVDNQLEVQLNTTSNN